MGIASTLLNGGRTPSFSISASTEFVSPSHPLVIFTEDTGKAKTMQKCELIVWNENTMSRKSALEALHRTLQDLRKNEDLMGGVISR